MVMVCFLLKYVPLNVQTQCWAWMKLTTDNFSTVLTKTLQNPCDCEPIKNVTILRERTDISTKQRPKRNWDK